MTMLLRSSSTPILGSLLSSFNDSPNAFDGAFSTKHSGSEPKKQLSFNAHHQNFRGLFTCNSSPINHNHPIDGLNPDAETKPYQTVRRAHSDGNLLGLVRMETHANDEDADVGGDDGDLRIMSSMSTKPGRWRGSRLESIPSFSGFTNRNRDDEEVEEGDEGDDSGSSTLDRTRTPRDGIARTECGFSFDELAGNERIGMASLEEVEEEKPLFLAKGMRPDVGDPAGAMIGGNGANNFDLWLSGGGDDDESEVDKYYQKMLVENPANPLFLRNYAQYLHKTKKKHQKAEEFYSRAILAEPGDGEVLSQYAEFIWEVYRDSDRAANYYEQAVKAAPDDSHVLAAYARFLWDTEESEDGEEDHQFNEVSQFSNYHGTSIASTSI